MATADSGSGEGDWPEVCVDAPAPADATTVERLEDWLLAAGALSVTLIDADDAPASSGRAVLEPAPGETRLWRRVTLKALFARAADTASDPAASNDPAAVGAPAVDTAAIDRALRQAAEDVGVDPLPDWRHLPLADAPWERAWMAHYAPMRFGERLIVAPHDAPLPAAGSPVVLRLDPGLAFGTGTHPTTALCLEWLDAHAARLVDARVIDYGAGSGVLAIAALLFGARRALAVDIDAQAHLACRENARRNGVADRLVAGDAALVANAPEPADVLLANILHAPLLEFAERFATLLRPGGALVLSGVLASQSESLRLRYTSRFDVEPEVTRDGWVRLSATRRP